MKKNSLEKSTWTHYYYHFGFIILSHLRCNPDWTMPTPLCTECQHLTCTNYSLPRILLLMSFCLLFAIFLRVSDLVTSTGFLPVHYWIQFKIATLTYKTLATCQPSYVYNLLQLHQPLWALRSSSQQLLQVPYICLQIMVGTPSATALLQHGIPFLPPSKIVRPYIRSFKRHLKSHLIAQLINN